MLNKTIKLYVVVIAFAFGAAMGSSASMAAVISASVGGVPLGAGVYENFDNLGPTGGTSNGLTVSFSGTGAGAIHSADRPGYYAAPYISDSNGGLFGNSQAYGRDETQYLTTGIGQVTLQFDESQQYFGLLWGSVDHYNSLSFYDGATLLFSFSGLDVDGLGTGSQAAGGTLYVNIDSDTPFDRVVASSTEYGFEFDNIALAAVNSTELTVDPIELPINPVPEPGTLALLGVGLLASIVIRQRRLHNQADIIN